MVRIVLSLAVAALIGVAVRPSAATAQAAIGNRANGLSYQPTQGQVASREKAAGVQPPSAPVDKRLETIDRTLLRKEGASTSSVPNVAARP